MFKYWT